jgi:hypothetical protein
MITEIDNKYEIRQIDNVEWVVIDNDSNKCFSILKCLNLGHSGYMYPAELFGEIEAILNIIKRGV